MQRPVRFFHKPATITGLAQQSTGPAGRRLTESVSDINGALQQATWHIEAMVIYMIATRADRTGFDVEIEGTNDARETTSFKSQEDAEEWVVRGARLIDRTDPLDRGFRMLWRI